MPQLNDLSRSLVILEQDATLIAVIEMGQSNWLVAGIVPGVERSPPMRRVHHGSGPGPTGYKVVARFDPRPGKRAPL